MRTGVGVMTRMFRAALAACAASGAVFFAASGPAVAERDLGTWLNADRKGKIALRECENNTLCGNIVWLKDAVDEKGRPWRDRLNPESKLRARPVVGLNVLIGVKKIGPNTWQGYIYDPEVGKVYYLKHLKLGQDKVEIKGCLKSGWPCRTKYWTRTQPMVPAAPPIQVARRNVVPPMPTPAPRPQAAPPAQARMPQLRQTLQPRPRTAPPQTQAARTTPPLPQAINPAPPQTQAARSASPQTQATRPAPQRDITAALPWQSANSGVSGYLVQVAARQSHNEAMQAFNDLQRRYPQLLGGLAPQVLRADLGQRGVWYRVGIGPMAQQSAAANFCQQLKSLGADCLIRRR